MSLMLFGWLDPSMTSRDPPGTVTFAEYVLDTSPCETTMRGSTHGPKMVSLTSAGTRPPSVTVRFAPLPP